MPRTVELLHHLGCHPIEIVYTIFGCWRFELVLHPDNRITYRDGKTPGAEHFWERDGETISFRGPHGRCATFVASDNKAEMRGCWTLGDAPPAKIALSGCHGSVEDPGLVCIVIGAHGHADWAIANARACRYLNPGAKVLVTDDCSSCSVQQELANGAARYGFAFESSTTPLGHWAGDARSLRVAVEFAHRNGAAIAVRCNQRTIQLKPNWAKDLAVTMLSDDAAVAYQCCWNEPHNIRTEFIGLATARWLPHLGLLHCGRLPLAEPDNAWLFENWFHDLAWVLFPWSHTPIPWFSRHRWHETEWTLSYYAGTSGAAAMSAIEAISQKGEIDGH